MENSNASSGHITLTLYGTGSEFIQGFISEEEYQNFKRFQMDKLILDDGEGWLAFLEENRENGSFELVKEEYWDYNEVSHFTGLNLRQFTLQVADENDQPLGSYTAKEFREAFEESCEENSLNVSQAYGKALEFKQEDCLVTYQSEEKITMTFTLPNVSGFDPLKLGFRLVCTDEMGYGHPDYGDFCLGIVYDGIIYDDPEFSSYGGQVNVYFER